MNGQHPDEFQQLKIAAGAVQSLREFVALDEELDVGVAREALVQIEQAVISRTDAIEQAKGQFAHSKAVPSTKALPSWSRSRTPATSNCTP